MQNQLLNNSLIYLKFIALIITTILSWQSLAYAANIGVSLIYIYIGVIILFHIPNLVFTKYLLHNSNKHNLIFLVYSKLGYRPAMLVTLLPWLSNITMYPSVFTFILANYAYAFDYKLSNSEYFIGSIMLYLFMSAVNIKGFKVSFKFILLFSMVGVIVPMLTLGAYFTYYMINHSVLLKTWLISTQVSHPFNIHSINFGFILAIIMTLIGFEQASLHSKEIIHKQFNFRFIHFISAGVILIVLTLWMMLILAYVSSTNQFEPNFLIAGTIIKVFTLFKQPVLGKIMVILFLLGVLGNTFAWMVHINRSFISAFSFAKSDKLKKFVNEFSPKKLIKFELLVFLGYFILLKIFPILTTSVILYNLSVQLSISYYLVLYLAVIRDKEVALTQRMILRIGFAAIIFAVMCSFIPNYYL